MSKVKGKRGFAGSQREAAAPSMKAWDDAKARVVAEFAPFAAEAANQTDRAKEASLCATFVEARDAAIGTPAPNAEALAYKIGLFGDANITHGFDVRAGVFTPERIAQIIGGDDDAEKGLLALYFDALALAGVQATIPPPAALGGADRKAWDDAVVRYQEAFGRLEAAEAAYDAADHEWGQTAPQLPDELVYWEYSGGKRWPKVYSSEDEITRRLGAGDDATRLGATLTAYQEANKRAKEAARVDEASEVERACGRALKAARDALLDLTAPDADALALKVRVLSHYVDGAFDPADAEKLGDEMRARQPQEVAVALSGVYFDTLRLAGRGEEADRLLAAAKAYTPPEQDDEDDDVGGLYVPDPFVPADWVAAFKAAGGRITKDQVNELRFVPPPEDQKPDGFATCQTLRAEVTGDLSKYNVVSDHLSRHGGAERIKRPISKDDADFLREVARRSEDHWTRLCIYNAIVAYQKPGALDDLTDSEPKGWADLAIPLRELGEALGADPISADRLEEPGCEGQIARLYRMALAAGDANGATVSYETAYALRSAAEQLAADMARSVYPEYAINPKGVAPLARLVGIVQAGARALYNGAGYQYTALERGDESPIDKVFFPAPASEPWPAFKADYLRKLSAYSQGLKEAQALGATDKDRGTALGHELHDAHKQAYLELLAYPATSISEVLDKIATVDLDYWDDDRDIDHLGAIRADLERIMGGRVAAAFPPMTLANDFASLRRYAFRESDHHGGETDEEVQAEVSAFDAFYAAPALTLEDAASKLLHILWIEGPAHGHGDPIDAANEALNGEVNDIGERVMAYVVRDLHRLAGYDGPSPFDVRAFLAAFRKAGGTIGITVEQQAEGPEMGLLIAYPRWRRGAHPLVRELALPGRREALEAYLWDAAANELRAHQEGKPWGNESVFLPGSDPVALAVKSGESDGVWTVASDDPKPQEEA